MSRYQYDTACPPPQAYEAVEGARDVLRTSGLFVDGANWLGSTNAIVAHEEPTDKPQRWIVLRQQQTLGPRRVDPSGLLKVFVHVKVVGEREMLNHEKWHGAMHARIQRALIRAAPPLSLSEVGLVFRLVTEPSRSEYYEDTDTRESFAVYATTLQPTIV